MQFNFNFLDKKIYAIVGKSDSGKDLLMDLITAKEKTSRGCVYLDGEPLYNNSKYYLFQRNGEGFHLEITYFTRHMSKSCIGN